jgi:hypothetical protein
MYWITDRNFREVSAVSLTPIEIVSVVLLTPLNDFLLSEKTQKTFPLK